MRFPNKNLKNSGFSMVEIMIAAGLLGGLALAVSTIMKNIYTESRKVESRFAEIDLANRISMILIDKTACENTLAGKPFNGGNGVVSIIKDKAGGTQFQTTGIYMNGSVRLDRMDLNQISTPSGGMVTTALTLNMFRLKPATNTASIVKQVYVTAAYSSGNITTCFVAVDNAISTACQQIGGLLNAGLCVLPSFVSSATSGGIPTASTNAASTQYLYDYINALNLVGTYVKKAGDTMTGVLNLPVNGLNVGTGQLQVIGNNVSVANTLSAATINSIGASNNIFSGKVVANGGLTVPDQGGSLLYGTSILAGLGDDTSVINKGDVIRLLGGAIPVADKQKIVEAVLQSSSATNDYNSIKNAILDSADGAPGNATGLGSAVGGVSCSGNDKVQSLYCNSSGCFVRCGTDIDNDTGYTAITFNQTGCSGAGSNVIQTISVSAVASGRSMALNINCTQATVPTFTYLYPGSGATAKLTFLCAGIGGTVVTGQTGAYNNQFLCKLPGVVSCPAAWTQATNTGAPVDYDSCSCNATSSSSCSKSCTAWCGASCSSSCSGSWSGTYTGAAKPSVAESGNPSYTYNSGTITVGWGSCTPGSCGVWCGWCNPSSCTPPNSTGSCSCNRDVQHTLCY